jgi:hypothetical protein
MRNRGWRAGVAGGGRLGAAREPLDRRPLDRLPPAPLDGRHDSWQDARQGALPCTGSGRAMFRLVFFLAAGRQLSRYDAGGLGALA